MVRRTGLNLSRIRLLGALFLSSASWAAEAQIADMPSLAAQVVESNPEIEAQRAGVRVLEARLQSARRGYLPTIEANALVQRRQLNIIGSDLNDTSFTAGQVDIEGRLRLYDGMRTSNAIKVAEGELDAAKANLDGTISDVLMDLLRTSADIHRDRKIRQYAQEQLEAIGTQLRGTRRRLEFGEATRTDESQARARLATSQAGVLSASEELDVSSSEFEAVSGQSPDFVPRLPELANIPATLEEAQSIASTSNPRIIAALRQADAAKEGVDYARGALAPQIDLVGGYEYLAGGVANLYTGKLPDDRSATYVCVEMRVPIFQGGREYSEITRSHALHDQRMSQVDLRRRAVVQEVRSAWARWKAAFATIDASRIAEQANVEAAEGVAKEALGGNRTALDALDAQNELLNARVAVERAVRNEYVARATLLAVIGRLQLPNVR